MIHTTKGVRYRVLTPAAVDPQINPSWWTHWAILYSIQCSTTGIIKAAVYAILSVGWRNEGNVLFNDALNTFYLRLYGVKHMVKFNTDSERGNPLPPHVLLFLATARVLLYAPFNRQYSTYHILCYTSRGALTGPRNSSMGPPWRINPTPHRTMNECYYHGATFRSLSGMMHVKDPLLLIGKRIPHIVMAVVSISCCLSGRLPDVWWHVTINNMYWVCH